MAIKFLGKMVKQIKEVLTGKSRTTTIVPIATQVLITSKAAEEPANLPWSTATGNLDTVKDKLDELRKQALQLNKDLRANSTVSPPSNRHTSTVSDSSMPPVPPSLPKKPFPNLISLLLFGTGVVLGSIAIVLFATGVLAPIGGLSAWASAILVGGGSMFLGVVESALFDAVISRSRTKIEQEAIKHKKDDDYIAKPPVMASITNPIPSLTQFFLGTLPNTASDLYSQASVSIQSRFSL